MELGCPWQTQSQNESQNGGPEFLQRGALGVLLRDCIRYSPSVPPCPNPLASCLKVSWSLKEQENSGEVGQPPARAPPRRPPCLLSHGGVRRDAVALCPQLARGREQRIRGAAAPPPSHRGQ